MKGFIKPDNPAMEKSTYHGRAVIDGVCCTLGIMDTTGMEELTDLLEERIRSADSFILIYSIWSHSSFDQIRDLYGWIRELRGEPRGPILIFENQSNVHNKMFKGLKREVSENEGSRLAKDFRCNFIEGCVSRRSDVEKGLFDLVRSLRRRNDVPPCCGICCYSHLSRCP